MPNASELTRKNEELLHAVGRANNLNISKAGREAALREVRQLERELGVTAIGAINQHKPEPFVVTLQDLKDARKRVETLTPGEIGTIIIALSVAPGSQAKALIAKLLGR